MDRNILIKGFIFVAGAAVGSAATWKIVKTKYEQIAQEEIDSVKEEYGRLTKLMRMEIDACRKVTAHNSDNENYEQDTSEDDENSDEEREFTEKKREQIEYSRLASKYRSSVDHENETNEEGDETEDDEGDEVPYINGPYVISPEEFASSPPGFNACTLDYFADGILADSWQVEVNIEDTIGEDALNHFGEYVDDVVYVRNERTQLDYEVTRDPRTYEEAIWG